MSNGLLSSRFSPVCKTTEENVDKDCWVGFSTGGVVVLWFMSCLDGGWLQGVEEISEGSTSPGGGGE